LSNRLYFYQVFNTDLVWQILYIRDIKTNLNLEEKKKIIVYDWKQLYKDKQMQASIKDQRVRNKSGNCEIINKIIICV